jgi:hypothetical protein
MVNIATTSSVIGRGKVDEILSKALLDGEFRVALLTRASEALSMEELSAQELELLSDLQSDALEEYGIDVRPYRGFLRVDGQKCKV